MPLLGPIRRLNSLIGVFKHDSLSESLDLLYHVILKNFRGLRVKLFTRHLHGPRNLKNESDDVVILCLFRDGVTHLPHFMDYHRKLGVAHFVFLDNGSIDDSMAYIKAQPDTTLFFNSLPFGSYKWAFKQFLSEKFARNCWGLLLDIDECFDFPNSDRIQLRRFISYLEQHGYNAVVGHLLEMFSEFPILEVQENDQDLSSVYKFYDLTKVVEEDYKIMFGELNDLADGGIRTLVGGVRERFFNYHGVLTKHPLFRLNSGAECTTNGHDIRYAKVADVTTVLYHYKYNSTFTSVLKRAIDEKGYYGKSVAYLLMNQKLSENPNLTLFTEDSKVLNGTDELLEAGFLHAGENYLKWVDKEIATRQHQTKQS